MFLRRFQTKINTHIHGVFRSIKAVVAAPFHTGGDNSTSRHYRNESLAGCESRGEMHVACDVSRVKAEVSFGDNVEVVAYDRCLQQP